MLIEREKLKDFLKKVLFLVINFFIVFLFFPSTNSFAQDTAKSLPKIPTITITPTKFVKVLVRVPPFEGERRLSAKYTQLLRKLLKDHLFIDVLVTPPIKGNPVADYYVKAWIGENLKKEKELIIEIKDLKANKVLGKYILKTKDKFSFLIYRACDLIVSKISKYHGIAETKLCYVKRTSQGDFLYFQNFDGSERLLIDKGPLILFPQFSHSGKKLLYLIYFKKLGYVLVVYDLTTGRKTYYRIRGLSGPAVWGRNDNEIFFTLSSKGFMKIYKYNLRTKKLILIFENPGVIQAGDVSPDGNYLLFVWNRGLGPQVYLYDLRYKTYKRLSFEGHYNTSPKFLGKTNKILYISRRGSFSEIIIQSLNSQKRFKIDTPFFLETPSPSPYGDYVMVRFSGNSRKGILLIHLDSGLFKPYLSGKDYLFPAWSTF